MNLITSLESGYNFENNYIDLPVRFCYIIMIVCSPVAQLVEQVAVNHPVGGSSPSRGAIISKRLNLRRLSLLFWIF